VSDFQQTGVAVLNPFDPRPRAVGERRTVLRHR